MVIYHSRSHLFGTLAVVAAPFFFLLGFARFTEIAITRLLLNVLISSWRVVVAYLFAAAGAWLLAVLFYRGRRANVALPVFDVLQSFPTSAALPLAIHFWGPSNSTTIFFLVITIIWPILFSVLSSLKLIKHEWEEVVIITRLSGWEYLRRFLWPVSVPGLVTGSIVGLGNGWGALGGAEIIVGNPNGLGTFFQTYAHDVTTTTLGILGFLVLVFSVNKIVWLPLLEWSHHETEE